MKVTIRQAVLADVVKLVQFNFNMAKETEGLSLDIERLKTGVEAVFADSGKGFYLVGEVDGEVRSCLMVTTEWSDWRNGTFWWIQSVYVQKEFRKQGLYKKMYSNLIKRVDNDMNVAGIRLYVEENNDIAKKTYIKLGMVQTDYQLYEYSKIKLSK